MTERERLAKIIMDWDIWDDKELTDHVKGVALLIADRVFAAGYSPGLSVPEKTDGRVTKDAERYRAIKSFMGHLQNGTQTDISISQDDATFDTTLTVGKNRYHGPSLDACIHDAIAAGEWDNG